MVSRNQLIIVTAIVFLGLMGPISFFFEPGNTAPVVDEPAPVASAPSFFVPTAEYTATTTAKLIHKDAMLSASAFGDMANSEQLWEIVMGIDGVKNATVDRQENPGEGLMYVVTFEIILEDGSDGARVGYLLSRRLPLDVREVAQTASIELPPAVSMQGPSGTEDVPTSGASIQALVFSYANAGEDHSFQLRLRDTGATKEGVALMIGTAPNYPSETKDYETPVTVKSVNAYGLETSVSISIDVNVSLIQSSLSDYNATVDYQKPQQFVTVTPSNSSLFLKALNDSEAIDFEEMVLVPYADDVESVIAAAAEESGTTVDYELPVGRVQVRSVLRVPADLVPGELTSEFALADVELPETLGNLSTDPLTVLPDRKVPVDAKNDDVLDATVTLTIVFGELDSVNAVISLE